MAAVYEVSDPFKWKWKIREWQKENFEASTSVAEVLIDPLTTRSKARLAPKKAPSSQLPNGDSPDFVDPLGATRENDLDPVFPNAVDVKPEPGERRGPVLVNTLASSNDEYLVQETHLPGFQPWSAKRLSILEQFMASESLSIKTSFLPNGIPIETHLATVNRQAQRVQQFEDVSGQKKYEDLSQEEYVRALNEMRRNLLLAWSAGRRVESIAIMVDLVRILSSTSSPQFYPSQFVLVTDILDLFGELVFERLLWKTNEERKKAGLEPLSSDFTLDEIPPATQNTAKNWFCKIGAVTELLPRLYVEASIIRCFRFLDPDALAENFLRLCEMPNYISQPLVATYARAYICRIIMRISPNDRRPHWKCLNDWISLSAAMPLTNLLTPALEWMVQCAGYHAISFEDMLPVWNFCRVSEKRSLLLRPFITSVDPTYLCEHSVEFCKLILQDEKILAEELCLFGKQLLKGDTPEGSRRCLLRSVWQKISKLAVIEDFVKCTVTWVGFAALYFPLETVDIMIGGLIKKLAAGKQYEKYHSKLMELVELLVKNKTELIGLMAMEHFTQLLDLILEESARVRCSELVLNAFVAEYRMGCCENFRIAYQVLVLCKRLHDSLSISADEKDVKVVADLIEKSLDRLYLDKEPERALNFYVDTRAALSNVDAIVAYLVTRICNLGSSFIRMGRISRTGASFLRACIASAFITIASIIDPVQRLYLYLQCGTLGLLANSLPQVDATVKCCIELLAACPEVSPSTYRTMASSFLAFLVLVPDSPNKQPFYAFNAFLNAIARYSWNNRNLEFGRLLIQCLHYLSTMRLPTFPYHIGSVQSNDAMYGNGAEFLDAIGEKEDIVIGHLEGILQTSDSKLHVLSMELLELILGIGSVDELLPLVIQLYEKCVDRKELFQRRRAVYDEIKRRAGDSKKIRRALRVLTELENEVSKTTST